MYHYQIIVGAWYNQDRYVLGHKNKYSNKEFLDITKGAVGYLKNRKLEYESTSNVIEVLVDIYGFRLYEKNLTSNVYCDCCISQVLEK